MNKENDLFLNMLYNPDLSLQDLHDDGLTLDNTGMQDMDSYRNNEKARRFFTTDDGKFDEKKFQTAYQNALASYNMLAQMDTDQAIINRGTYSRTNIFAPIDRVRKGPDIGAPVKVANPLRQQGSITTLGRMEDPKFSISEIAQTQQVYDPETGKWSDAPNDTFMGLPYFFDTLVLAQWDEDGTHVDPVSGEEVKHSKGELKLNDDGTYYYEKLAGRSVYDKQVLNKMNILTTDGSWINKYDFFDSDDINEKSAFGTILKNAMLVGTMFIPTVGPWIAAASIASQSVGWLGTLGKMLTSSDNELFSNMEGWSKSVNRQTAKTDYAQQNFMCWENMIDLIGDVVGQLNEQRVLFRKLPAIFKGKAGMTDEGIKGYEAAKTAEFYTAEEKKLAEALATKNNQLLNKGAEIILDPQSVSQQAMFNASTLAKAATDAYVKSYNKIGSVISKAYMTAITTQDMYGEAKNAGASDIEATLLTLGYSAAEAWLLNTGVGEHILPELRAEHIGTNKIVKALADVKWNKEMDKVSYAKALFRKGKDLFNEGLEGGSMAKAVFAHGLGEGIEEVSEELLADFSRGCFNLSQWLQNDDTRMNFDNWQERYLMSFVGGVVGGAINAPFTAHEQIKGYKNINSKQAFQEAMYMMRNGKKKELYKAIDDNQFANKHLSSRVAYDINGKPIYETAKSYEDSQDFEVKQVLKEQLDNLDRIMKTEGGNLSDDTFLSIQTKDDIRFKMLQESAMASKFLQNYQNNFNQIYDLVTQLNPDSGLTDRQRLKKQKEQQEDSTQEETEETKNLKEKLNDLRTEQKKLLSGEYSADFIGAALFEMSPALNSRFIQTNFVQWAEKKSGKDFDNIPEDQKKELSKQFKEYMDTDGKDDIWKMFQQFKNVLNLTSDKISQYDKFEQQFTIQEFTNLYKNLTGKLNTGDLEGSDISQFYDPKTMLTALLNEETLNWDANTEEGKQTYDKIVQFSDKIADFINKHHYINSDLKQNFESVLKFAQAKLFDYRYSSDWAENSLQSILSTLRLVHNTDSSPIENLLNDISNQIYGEDLNYKESLQQLSDLFYNKKENAEEMVISDEFSDKLKKIQTVVDITEAVLNGVKTDNIDFGKRLVLNNTEQEVTNLWGYTRTLNELNEGVKGYKQLAELTTKSANILLQDLDLVRSKLNFLNTLNSVNNSQKLRKQITIDNIQTKLHYNRFKIFLKTSVPDDWNNKTELITLVNSLDKLESLNTDKTLSFEDRVELKKQYLKLQDGIYDFFQANSDRDFSDLFTFKSLDLVSRKLLLLNENSTELSDQDFLWWMISRSSVKASDFYNLYKKSLVSGIAPIPGQELSIYNVFASIINGNVYTKAIQDIRNNLIKTLTSYDESERKKFLKDTLHWTDQKDIELYSKVDNIKYIPDLLHLIPSYENITLIDGIAGSGKTTILQVVTNMLKNSGAKDVLKNIWISHGANKKSAEQLSKKLNTGTVFSREELMNTINNEWTNNLNSATGEIQYTADQFYFSEDGKLLAKPNLNKVSELPSMIVIDEIWKYTVSDLDIINSFAKENGIRVIVLGDSDQSQTIGKLTDLIKLPSNDYSYVETDVLDENGRPTGEKQKVSDLVLTLDRNAFITSPKLGNSNRTDNEQKNLNQKTMLTSMLTNAKDVTFHYYEDENTLNGEKVMDLDPETNEIYDLENFKKDIDIMIKNLKDDEKIGYIYYDSNSPTYQFLNDNYSEYIDFFKDSEAQGLEAPYYIMEINPDSQQYDRDLYTGITRSIKGSIIIQTKPDYVNFSTQDSSTQSDNLSEQSINKFTDNYIKLMDQLELPENTIEYKPMSSSPHVITPTTKSGGLKGGTPSGKPSSTPTKSGGLKGGTPSGKPSKSGDSIPSSITVYNNGWKENYSLIELPDGKGGTNTIFRIHGNLFTIIQVQSGNYVPVMFEGGNWKLLEKLNDKEFKISKQPLNDNIIKGLSDAIDVDTIKVPELSNIAFNSIYNLCPSLKEVQEQEFEDEEQILTDTDVLDEKTYKEMLNETNEDSEEPPVGNYMKPPIKFYSFNAFETGITKDPSGKINVNPARIDSINGLFNIENILGRKHSNNIQDYINTLAYLSTTLQTIPDKAKMCTLIARKLGLPEVRIQFAFEKVILDYENSGNFQIFNKNSSEQLEYIYSTDTKSKDVGRNIWIAKISTKDNLVLTVPIFTHTSPVTLINMTRQDMTPIYPELYQIYHSFDESVDENIKLEAVKNFLDSKGATAFSNLISLYLYTQNGIFNLDKWSLGKNWNEWTPAKNLMSTGPIMLLHAGSTQQSPGLNYTAKWINLSELAENPKIKISPILSSKTGIVDDVQVALPGHPFVLVSYDPRVPDLLAQYTLQQKNSSAPKKVGRYYVLPPKSNLSEFSENIYKRITKQNTRPIGQINTTYKLFDKIIDDPDFAKQFESLYPDRFKKAKEIISKLRKLSEQERIAQLNSLSDWSDCINMKGTLLLYQQLDRYWLSLTYKETIDPATGKKQFLTTGVTDRINQLETILKKHGNIDIWYKAVKPIEANTQYLNSSDTFAVIQQDYTYLGMNYGILGKIDSPNYYTEDNYIYRIFECFVKQKIRPKKNNPNMFESKDDLSFANRQPIKTDDTITEDPQISNIKQYLTKKKWAKYFKNITTNDPDEFLNEVVSNINNSGDQRFALIKKEEDSSGKKTKHLLVTEKSDKFKKLGYNIENSNYEFKVNLDDSESTNLLNANYVIVTNKTTGETLKFKIEIQSDGVNQTMTLSFIKPESVVAQNVANTKSYEKVTSHPFTPKELMELDTLEVLPDPFQNDKEFLETINGNIKNSFDDTVSDIQNVLKSNTNPKSIELLNKLFNYITEEHNKILNSEQDISEEEEEEKQTCSTPITLKFI